MGFKELTQLLRVKQYYKNVLIFLPLVFVGELFNFDSFLRVLIGFISLCLVSSSYYIINDIIDKEKDKKHPEKKDRPISKGLVSLGLAYSFSIVLGLTSLSLAYILDVYFMGSVFLLLLLGVAYSLYLKNIMFLDIITISVNFVIRAISGVFLVYEAYVVDVSPWLILVPFFLALFLSTAKRRSNQLLLNSTSHEYNSVLKNYDNYTSYFLFSTSTVLLIMNYSFFSLFSDFPLLLITIPIVLYAIFYFFREVEKGSRMARDTSRVFRDKNMLISILLWVVVTFIVIYF